MIIISVVLQVLGYADYVFTSVFTVEIVLKVTVTVAIISSALDEIVFVCFFTLFHRFLTHV